MPTMVFNFSDYVRQLTSPDPSVCLKAASGDIPRAGSLDRTLIAESGAIIPRLVELLADANPSVRNGAMHVLTRFSGSSQPREANNRLFRELGVIPSLLDILTGSDVRCAHSAAIAIHQLAYNQANRVLIVQSGSILPLVEVLVALDGRNRQQLERGISVYWADSSTQHHIISVLAKLPSTELNKKEIVAAGALPPLVTFLADNCELYRDWAAELLWYLLANNPEHREQVAELGGLLPLLRLVGRSVFDSEISLILKKHGSVLRRKEKKIMFFIECLSDPDTSVRRETVKLLVDLSEREEVKGTLCEKGGLYCLVGNLLIDADEATRQHTIAVLLRLMEGSLERSQDIVDGVVKLLTDSRLVVRQRALEGMLTLMGANPVSLQKQFVDSGAVLRLLSADASVREGDHGAVDVVPDIPGNAVLQALYLLSRENSVAQAQMHNSLFLNQLMAQLDAGEMSEYLFGVLANLSAYNDTCRGEICTIGFVPHLISGLKHDGARVTLFSVQVLACLAEEGQVVHQAACEFAIIPLVIDLLSSSELDMRRAAVSLLSQLVSNGHEALQMLVREVLDVTIWLDFLRDDDETTQKRVSEAFLQVSKDPEEELPAIVGMLTSGESCVRRGGLFAVEELFVDPDVRDRLYALNAVDHILGNLEHVEPFIRMRSAKILTRLIDLDEGMLSAVLARAIALLSTPEPAPRWDGPLAILSTLSTRGRKYQDAVAASGGIATLVHLLQYKQFEGYINILNVLSYLAMCNEPNAEAINQSEALDLLITLFYSDNEAIREAAISSVRAISEYSPAIRSRLVMLFLRAVPSHSEAGLVRSAQLVSLGLLKVLCKMIPMSRDSRILIRERGGIPVILRYCERVIQALTAVRPRPIREFERKIFRVVVDLARERTNCVEICAAERTISRYSKHQQAGIRLFWQGVVQENVDVRVGCLSVIRYLVINNRANKDFFQRNGFDRLHHDPARRKNKHKRIAHLTSLLCHEASDVLHNAVAEVLVNISLHHTQNREFLLSELIHQISQEVLPLGVGGVLAELLDKLFRDDAANAAFFRKRQGVPRLLARLGSEDDDAQREFVSALASLVAMDGACVEEVIRAGGVSVLKKVLSKTVAVDDRDVVVSILRQLGYSSHRKKLYATEVDGQLELVKSAPIIVQRDLVRNLMLGEGTFGIVYSGFWQGSRVAIKEFKNTRDPEATFNELCHEAAMMTGLNHRNIIRFYGVCLHAGKSSLVMDLMPGSLWDLIESEGEGLDWERRKKIALGIARGLYYLHTQSPAILHRDLKDENILMDPDGAPVISDFGSSKLKEADADLKTYSVGTAAGTPRWTAPERFASAPYTTACDVFSYAIVVWQLAALKRPWLNCDRFTLISVLTSGERLPIPKATPTWCKALISSCWAQRPEERPDMGTTICTLEATAT